MCLLMKMSIKWLENKLGKLERKCLDCIIGYNYDCGVCITRQKRIKLENKLREKKINLMTMELFF